MFCPIVTEKIGDDAENNTAVASAGSNEWTVKLITVVCHVWCGL